MPRTRRRRTWAPLLLGPVLAALLGATARADGPPAAPPPSDSPFCAGEYADDLSVLSPEARQHEDQAEPWTFCVRSTAVYECPSYGPDGVLRRERRSATAHGTTFGLRREGKGTLLVTNAHVASWPVVTDEAHRAGDVPAGCRRVGESLRLVEDEADDFEPDNVPVSAAAVDPSLDLAVLRAARPLGVLPWRIGRSAALKERTAVQVRGFPLGVLRATSTGKVVSPHDHDDQGEWNHDDFVVDALLSRGSSGSPVLAVNCRTRELELVGVFHAAYDGGGPLEVVVAIDQARPFLTTLERTPRPSADAEPLGEAARAEVAEAAAPGGLFFPLGELVASAARRADGALVFTVYGERFPRRDTPILALELLPAPGRFGTPGRLLVGDRFGLCAVDRSALDAERLGALDRLEDGLARISRQAAQVRTASARAADSRAAWRELTRRERSLERAADRKDLPEAVRELAARGCGSGPRARLEDLLAPAARQPASVEAPRR